MVTKYFVWEETFKRKIRYWNFKNTEKYEWKNITLFGINFSENPSSNDIKHL